MKHKQVKIDSIPNVGFFNWNTFEECKMYNSNLTLEEYNEAFGIKKVKVKAEKKTEKAAEKLDNRNEHKKKFKK